MNGDTFAKPTSDVLVPITLRMVEGERMPWLIVELELQENSKMFAEYKAMPNALEWEGNRFYKQGWNSDKGYVAYASEGGQQYGKVV